MKLYLLRLVYCAMGLSLAALALRALVAPPPDPDRVALDQLRPSCQVLIVGPSFVRSQIYLSDLKEEALRLGHPFRACKYAKERLGGFEQYHELRELLAQPWPKLELVLFDLTLGGNSGFREDNRFKPRIIRFHLPEIFAWYFQFWEEQRPDRGHARQLLEHGLHVLARALHVGVGAEHLVKVSPRGIAPTPTAKSKLISARQNEKRLAEMVKEKKRLDEQQPELSPTKRAFVLHEYKLFQERGVPAEVLLAPVWRPNSPGYGKLGNAGPVVHDFAQPQKYPSLYAVDRHKRDGHLTREGAHEYSRLLARLIVERLEKQP